MGEDLDAFFGFVARSLTRHAVTAVATGGAGNLLILWGDVFDAMDALDLLDTIDATTPTDSSSASSGGEVRFGNLYPDDRCLVDRQTGLGTQSVSTYISPNQPGGIFDDHSSIPDPPKPKTPESELPKPKA